MNYINIFNNKEYFYNDVVETDSFKNVILLVVFNYSSCTNNKDFIKQLYQSHFKQIIFYSDIPYANDLEINYINIEKGFYVHKVFNHFYKKYYDIIKDSSGVFYTMDDNIINVNLLHNYSTKKMIYYKPTLHNLDYYSNEWHWGNPWGKESIIKLINTDQEYKKKGILYSGDFSDFFYIPIEYITDKLFELFKLHETVFLEIAIPTTLHNSIKDESCYQDFLSLILWNNDRKNINKKEYIYDAFNKYLIIHPVKFNSNPNSKEWILDIFLNK